MAKRLSKKTVKVYKKSPHKSFKRTYREDYYKVEKIPGIMAHLVITFKVLIKNWKVFLPFLVLVVFLNIILVGILNESNYVSMQEAVDETSARIGEGEISGIKKAGILLISAVTTSGLVGGSSGTAMVFEALIFLMVWLTTIYMLRHLMAGQKIKMRDGLYNSMAPLISTLVVFLIALVECLPIFVLIIVYSAAVQTEFINSPFYALIFLILAGLLITLSSYLLSSSIVALVAVTAPGLYPMSALKMAADLMVGRKIKFVLRIFALILTIVLIWVVVMLPIILFDLLMKQFAWTAGIPFVPIMLTVMTSFTSIYTASYFYLYYRWILEE